MQLRELPPTVILGGLTSISGLIMAGVFYLGYGTWLPNIPTVERTVNTAPFSELNPYRLEDISQYSAIKEQSLFFSERKAQPFVIAGQEAVAPVQVRLTSVLITPQVNLAILQTEKGDSIRLRLGEVANDAGWRLLELQPRQAVVEGPQGIQTLVLRVYGGNSELSSINSPPPLPPSPPSPPLVDSPLVQPKPEQMDEVRRQIQERRKQLEQQTKKPPQT